MATRFLRRAVAGLLAAFLTCSVANAAVTNFSQDVGDTIAAWLAYAIANGYLSAGNDASGLVLVALLEERATADFNSPIKGYTGLAALDQCRARNAVQGIITAGNHVARGFPPFYSYVDGIDMMALSLYANTGGPDPNNVPDRKSVV